MQMTLQEPIAVLREMFRGPVPGAAAPETLERALQLCAALRQRIDDPYSRGQVDLLSDYAVRLFSGEEPWRYGESPGPQALRLQALKLLSLYERRQANSM
jgi:hypothetical protein